MHRCTPAFLGAFPRLPVPGRTVPPPSARRAVCTAGSVDGPAAACRSASVSFRMCGPMPGGLPVLPCVWAHGSSAVCTAGSMPACWDGRLPGRKSETETARMGTPFWCPLWLHSSRVPRHCLCLDRSLRPLCPPSAGGPRRVPDRGARGPPLGGHGERSLESAGPLASMTDHLAGNHGRGGYIVRAPTKLTTYSVTVALSFVTASGGGHGAIGRRQGVGAGAVRAG